MQRRTSMQRWRRTTEGELARLMKHSRTPSISPLMQAPVGALRHHTPATLPVANGSRPTSARTRTWPLHTASADRLSEQQRRPQDRMLIQSRSYHASLLVKRWILPEVGRGLPQHAFRKIDRDDTAEAAAAGEPAGEETAATAHVDQHLCQSTRDPLRADQIEVRLTNDKHNMQLAHISTGWLEILHGQIKLLRCTQT